MSADQIVDEVRRQWAPPPEELPSEWAAAHRRLPEASAARGSLWSNATQPALVGIMDAAVEPGIREIVMVKAAQAGGSEAIANQLGYHIHRRPCPILLAHPTADGAAEWMKETFDDMVRSTPELAALVRDRRAPRGTRQAESTLAHKRFPGGYLAAVGGNSPNAYARRSCRIVIADDASRLPPVVGEEGDPASLLRNRTETWPDALRIFVSTPTFEDDVIDMAWKRSDQRRFHLTCPGCGRLDYITWSDRSHYRVVWEESNPETARLECAGCGARLTEPERRAMVLAGRWVATRKPDEPGIAGFHLPRTVSILGNALLSALVADWMGARAKGREALRVFVNTALGEPWSDRDVPKLDAHVLMARREEYAAEVPAGAVILTAGVDVQADRLELQVVGWGEHLERWVVAYSTIDGDPRRAETWAALASKLSEGYEHESGQTLPIMATCVDSGFLADEVYKFTLGNQHRRVWAIKGESHGTAEPLVMRSVDRAPSKTARPVRLKRLNVDAGKAELSSALSMPPGRNGVHFPGELGESYFVQLTVETRQRHYVRGVAHEVWVKREGARNEAWDTLIYARAAFDLLTDGRHDAAVRKARLQIASVPVVDRVERRPAPEPAAPAPPPQPPPPQRPRAPRTRNWSGR